MVVFSTLVTLPVNPAAAFRLTRTGPGAQVGDVTTRPIYRLLQKERVFSLAYFGNGYELSDPYPRQRYRIAAIREVGTAAENGDTVHYYEVEFDPLEGG